MLVPGYSPGAEGPSWRLGGADVRIVVPVKPGGAFEAKTASLSGTLTLGASKPVLLKGEISVDLATIDTGIGLRNQHLREKYLEIARGRGFDKAVLSEIRLDRRGRRGLPGADRLRGQAPAARREPGRGGNRRDPPGGPERRVEASFPLTLTDFGIEPPEYLGVGVANKLLREGPLHRHAAEPAR